MELSNNSLEMKTEVETFIIEETSELIYDNEKLDRWNDLVGQLNLEGQTKIVTKEKSPIPFMHLKKSMVNVFETLCPVKVDVSNYSITPIPVEILDLVALSVRENYFQNIEIWYDDKSPDPVCVGIVCDYYGYINGKPTSNFKTKKEVKEIAPDSYVYQTNVEYYLIGKWADVKHSFRELKSMAIERFIQSEKNRISQRVKDLNRELEDVESNAHNRFN